MVRAMREADNLMGGDIDTEFFDQTKSKRSWAQVSVSSSQELNMAATVEKRPSDARQVLKNSISEGAAIEMWGMLLEEFLDLSLRRILELGRERVFCLFAANLHLCDSYGGTCCIRFSYHALAAHRNRDSIEYINKPLYMCIHVNIRGWLAFLASEARPTGHA
jgi:hypothetical protein